MSCSSWRSSPPAGACSDRPLGARRACSASRTCSSVAPQARRVLSATLWVYGIGLLLPAFSTSLSVLPFVFAGAIAAVTVMTLPYALLMDLIPETARPRPRRHRDDTAERLPRTRRYDVGVAVSEQEVVCTILSGASSERAVRLAARLAERLSLRLALIEVHVPIPPPQATPLEAPQPVAPWGPAAGAPPLPADDVAAMQEPPPWWRGLPIPPGTREDAITAAPAMALERVAQDPRTEVLVVGDQGGGAIRAKLEGNPGRAALDSVRCPLVLVPPPDPDRSSGEGDLTTVVCGVDIDDDAPVVAAGAGRLAQRLAGRLRIVHVREGARADAPPKPFVPAGSDENAVEAELFASCRAALPPDVDADYVTIEGDVADALHAAARELDAGLLAVGRPRHGTVGSAVLGSAVHELLRTGTTPLYVISAAQDDAMPEER